MAKIHSDMRIAPGKQPHGGAIAVSNEVLDLEAAKRLVTDLLQKLDDIGGDSERLQELREEVQLLNGILNVPLMRHAWVADSWNAVESAFRAAGTELAADRVKVGEYVGEIGRVLGMR